MSGSQKTNRALALGARSLIISIVLFGATKPLKTIYGLSPELGLLAVIFSMAYLALSLIHLLDTTHQGHKMAILTWSIAITFDLLFAVGIVAGQTCQSCRTMSEIEIWRHVVIAPQASECIIVLFVLVVLLTLEFIAALLSDWARTTYTRNPPLPEGDQPIRGPKGPEPEDGIPPHSRTKNGAKAQKVRVRSVALKPRRGSTRRKSE